jgi:hypothetical protein
MAKLYEINQEFLQLVELLESGEATDELLEAYDKNIADGEDKIRGYYFVYKMKSDELDAIDKEIKRLTAMKKSAQNSLNWFSMNIDTYLRVHEMESYKKDVVNIGYRKGSDFFYDKVPKEFVVKEIVEKIKLADFKKWAKDNPENKFNAIFVPKKTIQIK